MPTLIGRAGEKAARSPPGFFTSTSRDENARRAEFNGSRRSRGMDLIGSTIGSGWFA